MTAFQRAVLCIAAMAALRVVPGFTQPSLTECRAGCAAEQDACMLDAHSGPERGACAGAKRVCDRQCRATPPTTPPTAPPTPPPTPFASPCNGTTPCYLTRKGVLDRAEAAQYYATIDPGRTKSTLDDWKRLNGFTGAGGGGEVRAIYYQAGDLDIGRDMNCRQQLSPTEAQHSACLDALAACTTCRTACRDELDQCLADARSGPQRGACATAKRACDRACPTCLRCPPPSVASAACYVTNFGPIPGDPPNAAFPNGHPDPVRALADAVANAQGVPKPAFATVAMEYVAPGTAPNSVKFYAYGQAGQQILDAKLDSEGPKFLPTMCMACHGGTYNTANNSVTGASFLPFDLQSFEFSQVADFTQDRQEEAFRRLNQLVKSMRSNHVNSADPIGRLIDLWYPNGVGNANSRFTNDRYPPEWGAQQPAYLGLVAKYCRGCHIANTSTSLDFHDHDDFIANSLSILTDVCRDDIPGTGHSMPHAEVPFKKMWAADAARLLDQPGVLAPGFGPCLPPAGPRPRARVSARAYCLQACGVNRDACMADAGRPGAFPAQECAREFAQCTGRCPPQ